MLTCFDLKGWLTMAGKTTYSSRGPSSCDQLHKTKQYKVDRKLLSNRPSPLTLRWTPHALYTLLVAHCATCSNTRLICDTWQRVSPLLGSVFRSRTTCWWPDRRGRCLGACHCSHSTRCQGCIDTFSHQQLSIKFTQFKVKLKGGVYMISRH